ncbi:MAG: hypothetical protein MK025_00150 [Acidobacteriia bacterium]|nr:hypothetical protein [Terriglobia bacterium]
MSILSTFPKLFSAAKFTTIHSEGQFCPVGNTGCPCHQLEGDFLLCEDLTVLGQSETDTGKMVQAGAQKVLWGVARPEGYPALVKQLKNVVLNQSVNLLTEGNSVLKHLRPDLLLFVVNSSTAWKLRKKDSDYLMEIADFIIINRFSSSTTNQKELEPELNQTLRLYKKKQIKGEWLKPLDQWKDRTLFKGIHSLISNSKHE